MRSKDEKPKKPVECYSLLKKIFIIVMVLALITTVVICGNVQSYQVQGKRFMTDVFKPIRYFGFPGLEEEDIGDISYSTKRESTFTVYISPTMTPGLTNTAPTQTKPIITHHSLTAALDRSLNQNLPARLTDLVRIEPGTIESSEFPGMPEPCQTPRRNTGVEDVLCMVGVWGGVGVGMEGGEIDVLLVYCGTLSYTKHIPVVYSLLDRPTTLKNKI